MKKTILFAVLFSLCVFARAQRKTQIVEPVKHELADTVSRSLKRKVAIVCDPTYIGAPVGHTMKGMDNATARVILLQ